MAASFQLAEKIELTWQVENLPPQHSGDLTQLLVINDILCVEEAEAEVDEDLYLGAASRHQPARGEREAKHVLELAQSGGEHGPSSRSSRQSDV